MTQLSDHYCNLGLKYKTQGKLNLAVKYLKKAITLSSDNYIYHYNLGNAYFLLQKFSYAIASYQKSLNLNQTNISIKKNYSQSLRHQAYIEKQSNQHQKAITLLQKAQKINPQNQDFYADLLTIYMDTCNWPKVKKLKQIIRQRKILIPPFLSLAAWDDPSFHLQIAKKTSLNLKSQISHFPKYKYNSISKNKIKLGYLSGDFHNHAVSHLVWSLFKLHNRQKFTVFCYSYGKTDNSFYQQEIKKGSDFFFDLHRSTSRQIADKINNDKIDILVDLTGFTKNGRPDILLYQPSSIQISWLGYPGTIGDKDVNYILADKIIIPQTSRKYFTEKVLYFPYSYQINSPNPKFTKNSTRSDLGIEKNTFVFASFNHAYKITQEIFTVWLNILRQVPNSVLWLLDQNSLQSKSLRQFAKKNQIDPYRLYFLPKVSKSEHLTRLRSVDLCLDTPIYNGHTTTSDSLSVGTPVVTYPGKSFASRVSTSLLSSLQIPELIAADIVNYQKLALSLANSPQLLTKIKNKLQQNISSSPLFNTKQFILDLEQIYLHLVN